MTRGSKLVFLKRDLVTSVQTKGQLISKAIYGLLTSPKKRTDEFVLFVFLLFTANKSNSSVRFLGESIARQSAFRFYLTLVALCTMEVCKKEGMPLENTYICMKIRHIIHKLFHPIVGGGVEEVLALWFSN